MAARLHQNDRGVSPVVGMVLVLAISVLGISGVLVWGLPAINEMKASVEHQSIVTQFMSLDGDIKELAKATASKTAKLWRFSQAQGDFSVQAGSERWVVALDGKSSKTVYNITAYDLDNTDNKVVLVNNQRAYPGAAANLQVNVKADILDGGASIPLQVDFLANPAAPCGATLSAPAETTLTLPWATAGPPFVPGRTAICLYDSTGTPGPIVLRDRLLQIHLTNASAPTETVSYIWATDVGRAQWRLGTSGGLREAFVSNGVVIHGSNGGLFLDGDPTVTPPSNSAGTWRFFSRLTTLNGTASLGGQARLDILLSLYGSRALADETQGTAVKIWTYGTLESVWDRYFLANKYCFTEMTEAATGAPAGTKYMEFAPRAAYSVVPPDPHPCWDPNANLVGMKLILHHSVITAKG